MRLMGLEAIYRRPNTSKPAPGHRIFPYLLKGVEVNRVDQVWAADITYIPMAKGFLYLVAIMDWHSRHVLAWKLSNTMDTSFCVAALEEGIEAALGRKEQLNRRQKRLDGQGEAHLVALACAEPPEGRASWTLKLLADRLVECEIVESISPETVRQTLKKTNSSPG